MFGQAVSKNFELDLVIRDKNGIPTGRKSISTNNPLELWHFWVNHQPRRKKKVVVQPSGKSKKGNRVVLPKASEAEAILNEMYSEDDNTTQE